MLGVNTDDLADHRPGQRAAAEAGAEFPLVAAGFSKQDVRAASRRLGLRTWDKPAAACLASRIPTGTPVTVELLSTIDRAEAAVRALGFGQLRVRHHGETARIEVDSDDSPWPSTGAHEIVGRPAPARLPLRDARPRGVPLRQHERQPPPLTSPAMKLAMTVNYSGDFHADVRRVQDLERAGVDLVWVAEAYSFDSISLIGYLAAKTSTIQIGTGIINVFSRTATAVAQTAAGCDFVTGGRFVLGLGASGPQVIEGFHGVAYDKPMARIIDYINVCRMVLRREPVVYDGATVHVPLPPGQGTGLGKALKIINHPVRPDVPIFWASVKGNSVAATARIADGWLPIFFDPTRFADVWGDDLQRGLAERDPQLGPLQISAGGMLAIGDEYAGAGADAVLDLARPTYALYIGGMGARGQNFYTELAARYGYEREAKEIQDLYLDGNKDEAARLVPREMLANTNLVGIGRRGVRALAAYREAGVTHLQVMPVTPDPVKAIDQLRATAVSATSERTLVGCDDVGVRTSRQ